MRSFLLLISCSYLSAAFADPVIVMKDSSAHVEAQGSIYKADAYIYSGIYDPLVDTLKYSHIFKLDKNSGNLSKIYKHCISRTMENFYKYGSCYVRCYVNGQSLDDIQAIDFEDASVMIPHTLSKFVAKRVINIPSEVTEIADGTFANLLFEDLNLPENLRIIGNGTFRHTGVRSLTIPENVTDIKERAFYACGELRTIDIFNVNVNFGQEVFANCSQLHTVRLHKIESIQDKECIVFNLINAGIDPSKTQFAWYL